MSTQRWWERLPGRLAYELEKLDEAGISYERDDDAFRAGVMKLTVRPVVAGRPLRLVVTFPDLYPYFRFEVEAPDEDLPHHQNPWLKNLCLLGRGTFDWNPSDTVAGLIDTQIPTVIETGRSDDLAAVTGREQEQAEPFSDFYPYEASTLLVDGSWSIPKTETSGDLVIGLPADVKVTHPHILQAAVLEVRGSKGQRLAAADPRLLAAYAGPRLTCRWVRSDKPIRQFNSEAFFNHVRKLDPTSSRHKPAPLGDGHMTVYGVVFPEEVGWRTSGDGWVFVCLHEWLSRTAAGSKAIMTQSLRPKGAKGHGPQPTGRVYFARASRAGPADLTARLPAAGSLGSKTVALFGLGCLGAPSALELARAGVGEIRVLDIDTVDPGTACRWPVGLSAAGRKKVDVIRDVVARDYPYTRVVPVLHLLGASRFGPRPLGEESDEQVLRRMTQGAHLVYDATAEIGVQHFLSDTAAELGIPYLSVTGTYGGWGGTVVRIVPGRTEGCWLCYRYACADKTIPEPPVDPSGRVQPAGCANPSYIGAGFDLSQVALTAVRAAVATLGHGDPNGYPDHDWDVMAVSFRDIRGTPIAPRFEAVKLKRHPNCRRCNS